jgi:hypothetical protein
VRAQGVEGLGEALKHCPIFFIFMTHFDYTVDRAGDDGKIMLMIGWPPSVGLSTQCGVATAITDVKMIMYMS